MHTSRREALKRLIESSADYLYRRHGITDPKMREAWKQGSYADPSPEYERLENKTHLRNVGKLVSALRAFDSELPRDIASALDTLAHEVLSALGPVIDTMRMRYSPVLRQISTLLVRALQVAERNGMALRIPYDVWSGYQPAQRFSTWPAPELAREVDDTLSQFADFLGEILLAIYRSNRTPEQGPPDFSFGEYLEFAITQLDALS